ncbi:Diaminopimelate decarboxylase, partial [Caligus rogercresseyi]
MESVYRVFLSEQNLINDSTPSIDIFDLDYFHSRIDSLLSAFPQDPSIIQHTFASRQILS